MSRERAVIFYPHIGEFGGIEQVIVSIARGVRARGLIPTLLCHYDRVDMRRFAPELEVVELGDSVSAFAKARRLARWLATHAEEIRGLEFFFGAKAAFYGSLANLRGYCLHYTDPPSLLTPPRDSGWAVPLTRVRRRISGSILARGVRRAGKRVAMTGENARELQALYGERFEVILLGGAAPVGPVDERARCQGPTLRLLSVSRLAASKNLEWLLPLVDATPTRHPYGQVELVIVGEGPEREDLLKLAAARGVADRVALPGFLDRDRLDEEFRRADLFLVPARQGYGLPVLEALYRHVPVVMNRESRISEILEDHPWVSVSQPSCAAFHAAVDAMLLRMRENPPSAAMLGKLPTETTFVDELGHACGWW